MPRPQSRLLQWGRRGEPAETGGASAGLLFWYSFNGAAGVNLRKRRRIECAGLRSHRFNGAAGVNLRKRVCHVGATPAPAASMGPQG